jgi:hypothetical protein
MAASDALGVTSMAMPPRGFADFFGVLFLLVFFAIAAVS